MPQSRRPLAVTAIAAALAMAFTVGSAFAADLIGKIKSVNVDDKKMVIVEKETDKEITVEVNKDTEYVTGKKSVKDYDLAKLKKDTEVEITHDKNLASKVVVKKKAGNKKKKKDDQ